jgi:hypothetical protein
MLSPTYKRPLATLAVVGGLLIAAAPAGATVQNQRAVSDGTSNTVFFAAVADHGQALGSYSFGATQTGSFQVVGPAHVACDGIGA